MNRSKPTKPKVKANPKTLAHIGAMVSIVRAVSQHRKQFAKSKKA